MKNSKKSDQSVAGGDRITEIRNFESRLLESKVRMKDTQKRKKQFADQQDAIQMTNAVCELFIASFLFIIVTIPVFLCFLIRKIVIFEPIFKTVTVLGIHGKPMDLRLFNSDSSAFAGSSLFWYVLRRKLGLSGPGIRIFNPDSREYGDSFIFNIPPGIFSLWFVQKSSGIAHLDRNQVDREYYMRRNAFSDIALILKTVIAYFFHSEANGSSSRIRLFEVDFLNLTMDEAVKRIIDTTQSDEKRRFFFVNPDCFNQTFDDPEYLDILKKTPDIFPDGIGVKIACKMLRTPMLENVNGTDMLPFLCEAAMKKKLSIFLLGGRPGIAERTKNNLLVRYVKLKIAGTWHGYFDHETDSEIVINAINNSGADILLVAFGVPLQEKWIYEHFREINCKAQIGVGGLFDFYSGNIKRAPKWMREIGLEWLFRLLMEPRRMFKRYVIGNPVFLWRVMRWRKQRNKENQPESEKIK